MDINKMAKGFRTKNRCDNHTTNPYNKTINKNTLNLLSLCKNIPIQINFIELALSQVLQHRKQLRT